MIEGLPVLKPIHIDCDACALGKMHRDEFPMNVLTQIGCVLELWLSPGKIIPL